MKTHGNHEDERRKVLDANAIIDELRISKNSVIADLGCGPGYFTIPLARAASNGLVYAVEKDELVASHLRENIRKEGLRNVIIINASAEDTGIRDSSIDVVFIANVFHDIIDHARLLKEVKRMLKKEGRVVNIDWNKRCREIGPPLGIRMSKEEELEIFRKNSFILENEINPGPCHYCLVLRLLNNE